MLTEIEMRDIAIKHGLPMVPKGRDYPWAYIDKVIAFARAIEQASRRAALEEIAAWIEPQRNDVAAHGIEFAAAIRAYAGGDRG